MLTALEVEAATPAAFHHWNAPLDDAGLKLLCRLLEPPHQPTHPLITASAQTVHAELLTRLRHSADGQHLLDALRSLF